ncbi:DUF4435 domain-containing protein [Serratia sp. NPDC087055]|uniref:DUF4435 domain-containing protein n=1 Tax=Serratia sp. NPDC087055 TaxID=3364516 RepID=UPI00384AA11E
MMNFSEMMQSESYIRASTAIQSGIPKGLLYVENPTDIAFWRGVIQLGAPGGYTVKPISQDKAKGKRTLEKMYPDLHKALIVGVDSDFDYLCPDRHERAEAMNQNKFVLHTHVYSRENFQCCHDAIKGICEAVFFHEQLPSELNEALDAYSSTVYPALHLFAYLHNKDWQQHKDGVFIQAAKLSPEDSLLNGDLTMNSNALERLRVKLDAYINAHRHHIADEDEYSAFIDNLTQKNITARTAYLFVQGHYLHDSLIKMMLDKIVEKTQNSEKAAIKIRYPEAEEAAVRRNSLGEINNFYSNRKVGTLLLSNRDYHDAPFFENIRQKLNDIVAS